MDNSLKVCINTIETGDLTKENDTYIFSYLKNSSEFISLTMPIRQEQYLHQALHPIFEMHLPEGYLLAIIKKHFSKLTKTDDFGLLKIISNSVNGRISYVSNVKKEENPLTLNELLHPSSNNLFEELVSRFALNSALSGVQPKVLARINNKATLKSDEYIVKSWGEEYPQLAINEYYCMNIAPARFYNAAKQNEWTSVLGHITRREKI